MKEAAIYPITSPLQLAEHAPYVHNAVYMTQYQKFDPANVWLSKPGRADRSNSLAACPFCRGGGEATFRLNFRPSQRRYDRCAGR